jgi:hypothetical protein
MYDARIELHRKNGDLKFVIGFAQNDGGGSVSFLSVLLSSFLLLRPSHPCPNVDKDGRMSEGGSGS